MGEIVKVELTVDETLSVLDVLRLSGPCFGGATERVGTAVDKLMAALREARKDSKLVSARKSS